MPRSWLLCDFHIHTNLSDGECPLDEVVDLYGASGFDAISITDHILDSRTLEGRRARKEPAGALDIRGFPAYMRRLWQEARRAWDKYHMLLIPGVEVTNDWGKYHIVAIDVKEYIDPDLSVKEIVEQIHSQGAIAIAAHPHHKATEGSQPYIHLWENRERYVDLFDAWEIANRYDLFNSIGLMGFNYVANSDFHEPCHLYSWKTLIGAEKNTEAIKSAMRKNENISVKFFEKSRARIPLLSIEHANRYSDSNGEEATKSLVRA